MIRKLKRAIDVWRGKVVCVEREGSTLSIQVGFPDGNKAAIVITLEQAMELASILPDATAIPGDMVPSEETLTRMKDAMAREADANRPY